MTISATGCTSQWRWDHQRLVITTPAARYTLTPLAEDLIRFQVEAAGGRPVPPSGAVIKNDWPAPQATLTQQDGALVLTAGRMKVVVELEPLRLQWFDGERRFAQDEAIMVNPERIRVTRTLPPDEHYYGFGQKIGYLDKRGRAMTMWATDDPLHTPTTDPLYQSIPFFIALREGKAHGLFVDCTARSHFDMGAHDPADTYTVAVESPVYDAYIFAGPSMAGIIQRYTELTGRMELPPLWSLGFHQCRWSYFPEAKIRELAREFRERSIPCDALWLDIDYMKGYRVFTWDEERFPDPERLAADMAAQGFKLVTIVDPGVKVDPDYRVYQEGVKEGHFIKNPDGTVHEGAVWPGTAAFPDFLQAKTRRWWGDLHKEAYLDKGIAGI